MIAQPSTSPRLSNLRGSPLRSFARPPSSSLPPPFSSLRSPTPFYFKECTEKVAALLKGKVLVGHALKNDLKVLLLSHPRHMIRDTATHRPFMRHHHGKFRPRKLKDLAKEHLGSGEWLSIHPLPNACKQTVADHTTAPLVAIVLCVEIQGGEHTPDEDAKAAMMLYRSRRREWEDGLKIFRGSNQTAGSTVRQVA